MIIIDVVNVMSEALWIKKVYSNWFNKTVLMRNWSNNP